MISNGPKLGTNDEPFDPRWYQLEGLGIGIDVSFVLERRDTAAIGIGDLRAFRNGVAFTSLIRTRATSDDITPFGWQRHWAEVGEPPTGTDLADLFILTLELATGVRATSIESIGRRSGRPTSEAPHLSMVSGGGAGGRWKMDWELFPLPPPGPLRFIIDWPRLRVHFEHVVDANPILEAAARALVMPW
jgi:hypothetical protein